MDLPGTCPKCGETAHTPYCGQCGHALAVQRLSMGQLVHEAFHLFTHWDKGFLLTVKLLLLAPGQVAREYVAGKRWLYQKPFSMFFIAATFTALLFYWVNTALVKLYGTGDAAEISFYHQYMVLLQVAMQPFYLLFTWLFFAKSKYNLAEMGVRQLYIFSGVFLVISMLHLLKFIWPDSEMRYIELPVVVAYNIFSNLRFFNGQLSRADIIIRTILLTAVCFGSASFMQNLVTDLFLR
jgi:hypothetical protein